MLQPSTIQLLRFHFSFFLLPVFLFALSQLPAVHWQHTLLVFVILHLLLYPSSNGYNSYMDKDTTAIGGLASPLQPTNQLFVVSVVMDVLALILSCFISWYFAAGILLYILASRAYSYRGIRLKRFAIVGYLVVFVFQGAVVYWLVYHGCGANNTLFVNWQAPLAASCLIGGSYPLTQIYQHAADEKDGVQTISMLLGKRGTFVFSGILLAVATGCIGYLLWQQHALTLFYVFLAMMLPVLVFFTWWMWGVWQQESNANFKNSLLMNVIASVCTTCYFALLIIWKN